MGWSAGRLPGRASVLHDGVSVAWYVGSGDS